MKKALMLFLILPLFACAQNDRDAETDSTDYYRKLRSDTWHHAFDSINRSEPILRAREYFLRRVRTTNNYSAFTLFIERAHSDYSEFNNTLKQLGFPALGATSTRFGLGVSSKNDNVMFTLYFATIGLNNTSSKDNEMIRTSFSGLMQFDLGLDLLHIERVSLYPYGGLSLRFSELSYERGGSPNPNYTNLTNAYTDDNFAKLESVRIGYQYGIGLDYGFAYNKTKTSKVIVFLKTGVNKPFKTDVYKSDGIPDYKPGIKQGDLIFTFGIKFAGKR